MHYLNLVKNINILLVAAHEKQVYRHNVTDDEHRMAL